MKNCSLRRRGVTLATLILALSISVPAVELDAMFRIYEPDQKKMKTWKVPQVEMLPATASSN